MFRTEVVASKNFRKSVFYKVYYAITIIVFVFVLFIALKAFGPESAIGKFVIEHYNDVFRPGILIAAFLIFMTSVITKSMMKSPKRLGSIEIDENEIKYLVDDEVQENIQINDLSAVEFEYYSFRMRGNPMGCMNYLKLINNKGEKTFEITIANSLVKADLGDMLSKINQKVPVKVTYGYFIKSLFKDTDFKF